MPNSVTRPRSTSPLARVMFDRNMRLLAGGAGTSLLGDQFSLLATPWLVLQITGDPVALGIALALQGLPRAALMLLGGAVTDRLSPRRVMLVANVVRGLLAAMMAAAVAGSPVQLWMVYAFSVLVGIASGFAVPAENSIVPQLVRAQDLQAGNSVIMGLTQLAGFVGPSVAGVVIGHYTHSLTGVAVAYTLDAAAFAVSAAALAAMRGVRRPTADTSENLLAATASGLRFLWGDGVLRTLFAVLLAVNLLLMGPLMVGIPQLAHERLPEGAAAFGILMSAFAVGNLAGYLVAGALPRPDGRRLRQVVIALVVAFGGGIGSLGVVPSTWVDAGVLATLGLGNGFMAVLMVTWIQARTPSAMVGRMMSLMTLASTGLVPASEALAGVVGARSLTMLFVAPGVVVLILGVGLAFHPSLTALGAGLGTLELHGEEEVAGATRGEPLTVTGPAE